MLQSDLEEIIQAVFSDALKDWLIEVTGACFEQEMVNTFPQDVREEITAAMRESCIEIGVLSFDRIAVLEVEMRTHRMANTFKEILRKKARDFIERN